MTSPSTEKSAGNRAAKIAVLVIVSTVVSLALGEIVVRVRYGERFGPRPRFYAADARLGWKPAAGLDHTFYGPDYQIRIHTDADGYRLGELGEVDYTKDLVVVCGDSYAFGWGVSTEESFASHLDRMLNESTGARVVNLGVGGYGILQSCDRLDEFFAAHAGVHARLIILQHSINDATDNYRQVGYHLGMWETEHVDKERSRIHLVNLCRYAMLAREQPDSQVTRDVTTHPYLQDLLWSYRRKGTQLSLPKHVTIATHEIEFDPATKDADFSADSLVARQRLSPVQRELMVGSLNCIHEVARMQGATVVHTFIATTPEWYAQEVGDIARASADSTQCRAVVTGAFPTTDGFRGPINNEHSGGHFTPEFNRFWAETMAAFLAREQLVSNGSAATN
jgi:hypothetical protein